jgi:hypothetical protein
MVHACYRYISRNVAIEGGVLALRSVERSRTGSGRPGSGRGSMSKGSLRGPSMKVVTASQRAVQEGESKGHQAVRVDSQQQGSMQRNKVVPFEAPPMSL